MREVVAEGLSKLREAVVDILAGEPDIEVIGETADCSKVLPPDAGARARRARARSVAGGGRPGAGARGAGGRGFRVLALGGPSELVFVRYTLGYGAAGYVTKMQAVEGVRDVARGERDWVRPGISGAVAGE